MKRARSHASAKAKRFALANELRQSQSEVESDLKLDRPTGEATLRFAELCSIDKRRVIAKLKVVEIQLIEDIKEVRSQIQSRTFREPSAQSVKTKSFHETDIERLVFRSAKNVPADSRWIQKVCRRSRVVAIGRIGCERHCVHDEEIVSANTCAGYRHDRTDIREQTAVEQVVVGIRSRLAAEVCDRTDRSEEITARRPDALPDFRSPWESGVIRPDAIDLPTAEQLRSPRVSLDRIPYIPQRGDHPGMTNVVIGRSLFGTVVDWKSLISYESRSFVRQRVETLTPAIDRIELESIREPPTESSVHAIVIGIDIRGCEVSCKERRISLGKYEVLIYEADKMSPRASLIA